MITLEISRQARADAIASMQRYFQENMAEPIGNLPAGLLLDFFLEEVGPAIYNQAVADAQARMQQRAADLNGELYADEFPSGPKSTASERAAASLLGHSFNAYCCHLDRSAAQWRDLQFP